MPTRTESIKRFLQSKTIADLADLYNHDMECQVNVAQDGGDRKEGEYKGRRWHAWTDGLTTWKSFRIPYKANSEPEYDDRKMTFDLEAHAEGIGMTGWDWKNKVSKWVGYDFDAIVGHSTGLTNEQLEAVKQAAIDVDWVTIRKSTSGRGLHLYVFLNDVPTDNHTEHAALARAILGLLSALAGFDFQSKIDACGGNMWVWHRKMKGTDGLTVLKTGIKLKDVPPNWKDHVKVVTGQRRKNLPQDIQNPDEFEQLTGQRHIVNLDSEHQKLIDYFKQTDAYWWWDSDHHMLVTHTYFLKKAHTDLVLKGFFETKTDATNTNEQNCFAFPLRQGAWTIRRYTPGVQEHESWEQDGGGWTRCFYNREPDLASVARSLGGLEDPSGGFEFREAQVAVKAAEYLGTYLKIDPVLNSRRTRLKQHKDGRLIAEIKWESNDDASKMQGWLQKKDKWIKIHNVQVSAPVEPEIGNYDDVIRHLVTVVNEDCGWVIKGDNIWRNEPLHHVRAALQSTGLKQLEVNNIIGAAVFKCWKLVDKPFQPEYPGDREWNRNAAQLRFLPQRETTEFPTWQSILQHCGEGLDDAIKTNGWCKANGLQSGADYLKCWIASLFQEPTEPLPYLFFYGPQNSGKSIFHEALSLLLTKGYRRADAALISQSGFNAELEGAIICVIEETDLQRNITAYNRIKDWVTSRELPIHRKGETPYHVKNTTHWIQCSNDHNACPVMFGDTRITMCFVDSLDPLQLIPKKQFIPKLEKEAPSFLAEILELELPESNDRLNVPVIDTGDKRIPQRINQSVLDIFLEEKCEHVDGRWIKFGEFCEKFHEWCDPNDVHKWSKIKIGRELPPMYPKGRKKQDGNFYIGNMWWRGKDADEPPKNKYILVEDYLVSAND